jgi:phage repressor protein C with HTH and peptisase S24 domain
MLSHKDVWNGIDLLAARNGYSTSGLARRAGLDPTTFNKSKRTTGEGKPRWPSTESISKILAATQTSMVDFVNLMYGHAGFMGAGGPRLRGVQWTRLASEDLLDASGFPVGSGWEDVEITLTDDRQAYVVELDVDVAPPLFRRGDMMVVSPGSGLRRGDRVLLRLRQGPLQVGILNRRSGQRLALGDPTGREPERTVAAADVAWLGRIVWLSQ